MQTETGLENTKKPEIRLGMDEFRGLQERKPADGAPVIVRAKSGLLIPCFYGRNEL